MLGRSTSSIEVRPFRDGDVPGIAALQSDVEASVRVEPALFARIWNWLYRDNPMGPLAVFVGATPDGRIVGHEGIMPFKVRHHGKELTGGISCNLIVANEFRQTLLFPRIVQRLLRSYVGAGFDFIYGPARPHIAEALVRLGYRDLGDLPVFVRPFRFVPFMESYVSSSVGRLLLRPFAKIAEAVFALVRSGRTSGLEIAEVGEISDELGAFAESTSAQLTIHALRNREIMTWRYFALPHRQYRIFTARAAGAVVGYVAVRRMPMLGIDALGIVDLLFAPGTPEVGRALLREVHDLVVREHLAAAACMVGPGSPLIPLLRRAGYIRSPEGFRMVLHEPPGHHPRFNAADLTTWYVTWYDHDYV